MSIKFSERRIKSLRDLKRIINSLDLDEGVRVLGCFTDLRGGGFIFINKASKDYCVNTVERIYDNVSRDYVPGGKEIFFYYQTGEEVIKYIKKNASKPIKAWIY